MNVGQKLKRKKRRAKGVMGASGLMALLPVFEFIGQHESFAELLTPVAVMHGGPVVLGAIGLWWSIRSHHQATNETGQYTRAGLMGEDDR